MGILEYEFEVNGDVHGGVHSGRNARAENLLRGW